MSTFTGLSVVDRTNCTIIGKSIVPWRYFFNTVTFSYTTPFWGWEDWEFKLDWLALHGVNLPLTWVGYEKILLGVFRELSLTDIEILPFFFGPAFKHRIALLELQKQILERRLELGMTPILPAFIGFVPRPLTNAFPNAIVVNGTQWEDFPPEYTNTASLEPSDPLFAQLQNQVISKQIESYGNITQFYTLDQYNENDPYSGDLNCLRNITRGTWQSLKAANSAAVWVMQGWLFYSNSDFWINERIEAYLSGVEEDSDMLILDLFSESQLQRQRTNSYHGKRWIWNELHNYSGNQGFYRQIDNATINPIKALANSTSLVGFGLTPEGQEGNEVMYTLLLDQLWSPAPIDTAQYFHAWVTTRYSVVVQASQSLLAAADKQEGLWTHPAYHHDLVDVMRQVSANAFLSDYTQLMRAWNTTAPSNTSAALVETLVDRLLKSLKSLYALLSTLLQFRLDTWLDSARAGADDSATNSSSNAANATVNTTALAHLYASTALNQITIWGPDGEINDYASKQ
ncbi:glycoside hydrolase family 89 protein [Didymella exigua CBS 183.55]|uniref:Glycoside hydrolase family 89 protein n=1 Tax=Didymella exigua CBS 183.55 TaxID=1150837 RepID=A0A6A5RDM8_9PLEO|nr:glycoside hydrolase family 89 protein [Didymella exigua CBS 183.55]KAF1926365.1 glycoside hydrolase family 89 protein [Didymella exigua CBS 183.55]